jgi:hypothetical protein
MIDSEGLWLWYRACYHREPRQLSLDGQGSISGGVKIFFFVPQRPDRLWSQPNFLYNGYRGLFPWGVKRPGRETDHSPLSSAETKKGGVLPPLTHIPKCSQEPATSPYPGPD